MPDPGSHTIQESHAHWTASNEVLGHLLDNAEAA